MYYRELTVWRKAMDMEKAQFLAIAQGSLAETETFLTLCEEIGWFPTAEPQPLRSLLTEVGKMLTTLRRRFRQPR